MIGLKFIHVSKEGPILHLSDAISQDNCVCGSILYGSGHEYMLTVYYDDVYIQ